MATTLESTIRLDLSVIYFQVKSQVGLKPTLLTTKEFRHFPKSSILRTRHDFKHEMVKAFLWSTSYGNVSQNTTPIPFKAPLNMHAARQGAGTETGEKEDWVGTL